MGTTRKARIAYAGEALENGTMPVETLAPALLAFAKLVEESYKVIGGNQKIQVLLNHDSLKKGSFDITFLLDLPIIEQVKLFVSGAEANGIDDLMTVIGWGSLMCSTGVAVIRGVFALIKAIKGRPIKAIDSREETAVIKLDDNTEIITDKNTLKVFLSIDCRAHIEQVIEPLSQNGIDGFEIRNPENIDDKAPIVGIKKADAKYYKAPPPNDDLEIDNVTDPQVIVVKIISVNFDDGKWRLTDGTNPFWATIEDEDFLAKVDKHEISFSKGDNLRIEYHMEQKVKGGKLSTDYIVTKVLQQIKEPKQIKLDFDYKE